MRCPECSSDKTNVLDSRSSPDLIRRRRSCQECDHRFTTYERIEESLPMIVKKDGRREPFDRNKIRHGFIKACEKRPVSMELIEEQVQEIEKQIRQSDQKEVPSRLLGDWVMDSLRKLDKVAYVRFASVYREFSDINQFVDTLQGLMEEDPAGTPRQRVGNSE